MTFKHKSRTIVRHWLFLAIIALTAGGGSAASSRWQLEVVNRTHYESNIFHSFADTLETTALLDVVDIGIGRRWRQPKRLHHRVQAYANLDLYPSYSVRDQSAFGVQYKPYWRYRRGGKLALSLDISRRNKDLIDDAGQVLARTLKKWRTDLVLSHHYRFDRFDTELSLRYSRDNYDEVAGSLSYDYSSYGGRARLKYDLSSRLEGRATVNFEKRDHDERKTYTVKYGAFVGRPFEIREYTLSNIELSTVYDFDDNNEIKLDIDYARRKENFENFYGYDHWQCRMTVRLRPAPRHRTTVSFRFKDKQYENYWNGRIGQNNRVGVEYTDFRFDYDYQALQTLALVGYVRNYNKVSNDRATDYHNLTIGLGFKLEM